MLNKSNSALYSVVNFWQWSQCMTKMAHTIRK